MNAMHPSSNFRQRFNARGRLVGTFIKTPTTHAVEIIGARASTVA